ncbi:MAG: hypothetical protein AAF492_26810, partial [Verrucomicrobiota bacterium]
MRPKIRPLKAILVALCSSLNTVAAESVDVTGFYKNFFALTDARNNHKAQGLTDNDWIVDDVQRIRLKLDWTPAENFDALVHYEVIAHWGESVAIQRVRQPSPVSAAPRAGQRIFDLEKTIIEEDRFTLTHQIDRLRLRWQTDEHDLSVGRQPVSWGVGLIWSPLDLFAGFSPTEIDRDDKPGVDVIRWTWTPFGDTSFDLVAEPLHERRHLEVDEDASSLALRAFSRWGEFDGSLVAGQIAGDGVVGG